jgi:uncharacterized protein YjbI with pentapeptide repeats
VDLRRADLRRAKFYKADLKIADFSNAYGDNVSFREANCKGAIFRGARLDRSDFFRALLREVDFSQANLSNSTLSEADLTKATLSEAILEDAILTKANLRAVLDHTNLTGARLKDANLTGAILTRANLRQANLAFANLTGARLDEADLTDTDLCRAILVNTSIDKAKLSGSSIYGINVWDLKGEFSEQKDLRITNYGDQIITVDNIKVAQFIHLILNNEEVRDVITTLTSKTVLILGRFTSERKAVLDALKNELRKYNFVPIVFDFERPPNRDLTETVKALAGLAYFVIADVSNPRSSPLELQALVPDYQIPFVPIIQEGEKPFPMMADLQKKHDWVLDTISYRSVEILLKVLKPAVINPAIQKHNELRLRKAQEPKILSANDFADDRA